MPPKTLAEVKADSKLWAAYLAFTKRTYCQNEVLFYFDKRKPAEVWAQYMDPKSKEQVNLPGAVANEAKKLADKDDFDNPKWASIIADGKKAVADTLIDDIPRKTGFAGSPEYKKVAMGDPKKAAKILGIMDVAKLTKAMEEVVAGDKKQAEKLLAELAKSEELKDKVADMLKALDQAGLV